MILRIPVPLTWNAKDLAGNQLARSLGSINTITQANSKKPYRVMEIVVKELDHCDVISVIGYLERSTAEQLAQVLETSNKRGKYNLVIDLSQVEYIASAGFRTLLIAQQNNRRNHYGELILAQVPDHVRQVLELTGFGDFFHIFDDLSSAIEFAEQLPDDPYME